MYCFLEVCVNRRKNNANKFEIYSVFLLKTALKWRLNQGRLIQADADSETYQTSMMKRFAKIVNS